MIELPKPPAMSLTLVCRCGARQVIASGYHADNVSSEQVAKIAEHIGWQLNPQLCPKCQLLQNPGR